MSNFVALKTAFTESDGSPFNGTLHVYVLQVVVYKNNETVLPFTKSYPVVNGVATDDDDPEEPYPKLPVTADVDVRCHLQVSKPGGHKVDLGYYLIPRNSQPIYLSNFEKVSGEKVYTMSVTSLNGLAGILAILEGRGIDVTDDGVDSITVAMRLALGTSTPDPTRDFFWLDTTGGGRVLKVYDGTTWVPFYGMANGGQYSALTPYALGTVVGYNGSSYRALQASTGQTPAENAYWTLIAAKGDTGATGATGPQPDLSSATPVAIAGGAPAAGAGVEASKHDHVHGLPAATVHGGNTTGALTTNMTNGIYQTHALTGGVSSWVTSNRQGTVHVLVDANGGTRTLDFSASSWMWLTAKPTSLASGKKAVLSLVAFGGTEASVVAAWKESN